MLDNGDVLNTIEYRDVGIILEVVPRINPDGFVKLDVKPEISSISDSRIQITEGLNATVFNTRSAQTTVTVQDGHTIVLGGLITTDDQRRESKVPILGDIPLLGALFKSVSISKQRTELLIILTPRVVANVAEGDETTAGEIRRLRLMQERGQKGMDPAGPFMPLEKLLPQEKTPPLDPSLRPERLLEELRVAPEKGAESPTTRPADAETLRVRPEPRMVPADPNWEEPYE